MWDRDLDKTFFSQLLLGLECMLRWAEAWESIIAIFINISMNIHGNTSITAVTRVRGGGG